MDGWYRWLVALLQSKVSMKWRTGKYLLFSFMLLILALILSVVLLFVFGSVFLVHTNIHYIVYSEATPLVWIMFLKKMAGKLICFLRLCIYFVSIPFHRGWFWFDEMLRKGGLLIRISPTTQFSHCVLYVNGMACCC